jgi:hypothetical protein
MLPGGIVNNHPVRTRAFMPSLRGCRPYDGRPPRSHELAGPLRGHSSGPDPPAGSAVTAPEPPGSQPVAGWRTGASATARPQSSRRTHPAVAHARQRYRSGVSVRDEVGRARGGSRDASRSAFWLADRLPCAADRGVSGIPPVRACRSGSVQDQRADPGPREWSGGGPARERCGADAAALS